MREGGWTGGCEWMNGRVDVKGSRTFRAKAVCDSFVVCFDEEQTLQHALHLKSFLHVALKLSIKSKSSERWRIVLQPSA